jgi:hypothetical protein
VAANDLFQDENIAQGLPPDTPYSTQFQAGISDFDPPGVVPEQGVIIPWSKDAAVSYLAYDVHLECYLDSGIVVHRHLPQSDYDPDVLSSCFTTDANIDTLINRGVNLQSGDSFDDVVQRMAHSRYWFRLTGQAMRIGYQVPIPGLKTVGGVSAVPDDGNPQRAYNKIVGNYSGVVLWYAFWDLWYTISAPPSAVVAPVPPNLAVHIGDAAPLPDGMQAPFSQPDDEAQATNPLPQLQNPLG